MIYISSACSPKKSISHAVQELAELGFRDIELTGGTRFYDHYEKDLLELKDKLGLNYLIHNYFPPPENPFILNLASLDQTIYEKTLHHLKTALDLTRRLGGTKFGFHAGFFVDRPVAEIGRKFGRSDLYDKEKALKRFTDGFCRLKDESSDIELYIENNCYSVSNFKVYGKSAPFMLLNMEDYLDLKSRIDFKLLLDVGHLMVTSGAMNLDFSKEFQKLNQLSDYIHISNNDFKHDLNLGLDKKSKLVATLGKCEWEKKTITLEIYESMNALVESYSIVSAFFKGRG